MHVQYETTLNEVVDASLRAFSRSRAARSWIWSDTILGMIIVGLLTGLLTGALCVVATGVLYADQPETNLIISGIGAIVAAFWVGYRYPSITQKARRRRLRRFFQEQFRGAGPYAFEAAVSPEGLSTKQNRVQSMVPWQEVETILETDDSIEMYVRQGGGYLIIKKKAFDTADEMEGFLDAARRFHEMAEPHDAPFRAGNEKRS